MSDIFYPLILNPHLESLVIVGADIRWILEYIIYTFLVITISTIAFGFWVPYTFMTPKCMTIMASTKVWVVNVYQFITASAFLMRPWNRLGNFGRCVAFTKNNNSDNCSNYYYPSNHL